MRIQELLVAAFVGLLPALSMGQTCGTSSSIGQAWTHKEAVLFKNSVLNVDADGAPNSYLLNGNGLSYTCDGVVALENGKRITPKSNPKDWQAKCNAAWATAKATDDYSGVAIFGFQTDGKNVPLVQGEGDPLPGKAYVSSTSVVIPGAPEMTQRRYVDATRIPYIVLSPSFVSKYKIKPGTIAAVFRKKTGLYAFAVFADSGDLGEASVKLHQDLGSKPIQSIHGVERAKARIEDITIVAVFPSKVAAPEVDADAWNARIKKEGAAALDAFGGVKALQACAN
jgi:Fungal chitosanase of glycosyl hydrolase group 75